MNILRRKTNKLIYIQYLRAFAALIVLSFHIEGGLNNYSEFANQSMIFSKSGTFGVAIFFCLTGFLIPYSSLNKIKTFSKFIVPKIFRLYPTYIFVTFLFLLTIFLLPSQFNTPQIIDFEKIIKTLFFYPFEETYIFVSWTLFYQWIFYIGFAMISYRFINLIRTSLFPLIISICIWISYFMSSIFLNFIIGFSIFYLIYLQEAKVGKNFKYPINIFIFYSTLLSLRYFNFNGFIIGSILFLIIYLEKNQVKKYKSNFFLTLGNISYSIYLIQVITYPASLKLSFFLINSNKFIDPNYYLFYFTSFTIGLITTITSGYFIYRYIEVPCFNKLMSTYKKSNKKRY